MNRIVIAAIIVMLAITGLLLGCDELTKETITGSGNLETTEFELSGFSKLDVSHSFEVAVTRSDSYSVSITVDDNLLDYLDIKRSGDTLIIHLDIGYNYRNTTQLATVAMPDLHSVTLSGASAANIGAFSSNNPIDSRLSGSSSIDFDDLKAGDADFDLSGSSRVTGSLRVTDCEFDLSGSSRITLDGSGDELSAHASGSSRLNLDDFEVSDADIRLSGSSSATVNLSGTLDVSASGSSHLRYVGDPTLGDIDICESCSVTKK